MLSLTLVFAVHSYKITVVNPTQIELHEGSAPIDLGLVGPGQKLELQVLRGAGDKGYEGAEITWDTLGVNASTLPPGWAYDNSTLREEPLTTFLTVPKDAKDGVYTFQFVIDNLAEGLGEKVFTAQATVSKNVLQADLTNPSVSSGAGLPAEFNVEINNLASANDYFQISVSGVPKQMEQTRTVFVEHNSKQTFSYELVGSETQQYDLIIRVDSLSSNLITASVPGNLLVSSSVSQDAISIGNGLMLFPISEQAVYSLIGFFSNLFMK
ncbi:Uncharacterised protein [uncultured archaeon]|nr:Uncharacterised protein [uncultured archaeon]